MKKKVWVNSDSANSEGGEQGFWWNSGVNSIAGLSFDKAGLRFDGRDFTVIVDNPGQSSESVQVLVNDIVVFSSVKAKAS